MIITFKILPFKGLMHLLLGTEEVPSVEKKAFFIFLGKQIITRCSLFQLNVSIGIRQPAPGEGQARLHTMVPDSTDKFRIFAHEKKGDPSGSHRCLCSCSEPKRPVPLASWGLSRAHPHSLSLPITYLDTSVTSHPPASPPSLLLTQSHLYLLYSRLCMLVGISKFTGTCFC